MTAMSHQRLQASRSIVSHQPLAIAIALVWVGCVPIRSPSTSASKPINSDQKSPSRAGQEQPSTQWLSDLAAFDAEVTRRRSTFALEQHPGETKGDAKLILSRLAELDQYLRNYFSTPRTHKYEGTREAAEFFKAYLPRTKRIDKENLRIFRNLLERWGWFSITEWGDQAESDAWLLVQHADDDLPLQQRVLAQLESRLEAGKTHKVHYAYLFDRVAVNEKRPQRFGTQGFCTGPGKWTPRPIEDAENVDARRSAMGLPPLADYISSFRKICHEDETERAMGRLSSPDAEKQPQP
jgi:hypothetical protein